MSKEHIIWQNETLNMEDWEADLREEYPDATEDELYQKMVDTNDQYLDDERANLDEAVIPGRILVVAELGRWDGTHYGYKFIKSGRIADCLRESEESPSTTALYVDARGEFRARVHHHDGTNYYRYRGIRPGVSEERIERLTDLIYNRQDYEAMLRRLTFRLGDIIGDVYGWQFPNRPKCSIQAKKKEG